MRNLVIAIDFDNTITAGAGKFPACGKLRVGAREVINGWVERGHSVIINTCRNYVDNSEQLCIDFLNCNDVRYTRINSNMPHLIEKYGGDTRKISADIYFDDKGMSPNFGNFDMRVRNMEKPTVIAIVGESGSGKSMIADYIKDTYGIHLIQSRTTRKKRDENDTGHLFVTNKEFDSYDKDDIIAITNFGGNMYCCLHSDVNQWANTYVIDEHGLNYLIDNYSDMYNIFSIRVIRPYERRVSGVGKERVDRDEGKFTMNPDAFDEVIYNVSNNKEDVCKQVDDIIAEHMLYL